MLMRWLLMTPKVASSRYTTLPTKVHLIQPMVFPVVMYGYPGGENGNPLQYSCLEIPWTEEPRGLQSMCHKGLDMTEWLTHHTHTHTHTHTHGCESWTIKKTEHQRIDDFELLLEKTLESPLDCKKIQPVHPKENQSWVFIGRTDVEAETPILWPSDVKNWLFWKDPDAGKDWRREEKGTTEDEMVGCHHQLDGHEFEQALGVRDGQRSLGCGSPWGHKESDTTERLNWTGGFRMGADAQGEVALWSQDCNLQPYLLEGERGWRLS